MDKISSLAELVIAQHDQLDEEDKEHLTAILKGKTNHKVAILFDGYDEYSPGTNISIDKAISSTVGKCIIILTSRPEYLKKSVRDKMDGEILIQGFSQENIEKCSTLYLGSDKLTAEMLKQAEKVGLNAILNVPIILLIACMIFREKNVLPKTQTKMFSTVYELIMDRTTLKRFGCKSSELKNLDDLLYELGKLSLKSLRNNIQQLLLNKVPFCQFSCYVNQIYYQLFHKLWLDAQSQQPDMTLGNIARQRQKSAGDDRLSLTLKLVGRVIRGQK